MLWNKRSMSRAVFVVVLASLAWAAVELWRRYPREGFALAPAWALLSVGCVALGYLGSALGFAHVLRARAGTALSTPVVLELYFRGLLARYLPGKVGIPAVRMVAAEGLGVSVAFMAGTVVLETLASMAVAGLLGAGLLSLTDVSSLPLPGARLVSQLTLVSAAAAVLVLASVATYRYPSRLLRLLRVPESDAALLPKAFLLGALCLWVFVGLSGAALARAFGATDAAWLVAASCILAPVLGFLAVFAPAGLGVREALMTAALTPSLGSTKALALGLSSRAVALVAEVFLWLVSAVAKRLEQRRKDAPSG